VDNWMSRIKEQLERWGCGIFGRMERIMIREFGYE
jgi:hypothetical protein